MPSKLVKRLVLESMENDLRNARATPAIRAVPRPTMGTEAEVRYFTEAAQSDLEQIREIQIAAAEKRAALYKAKHRL